MSTFRNLLVAGLCLTPLAILLAQETGQRETQPGREQPGRAQKARDQADRDQPGRDQTGRDQTIRTQIGRDQAGGRSSEQLDKFYVHCLRADNQGEVTISKLAEQRATNPEVKAFAQQMIKDHTDMLAKLDRLNQPGAVGASTRSETRTEVRTETRKNDASDQPDATRQPDAQGRTDKTPRSGRNKDAANQPGARADVQVDTTRGDVTVQTAGRGAGGAIDQLVQVKQEISERCLATTQRELGEKEGKEFDQCFMFMQVGAHHEMVDTLTVLKNHTSGELQQTISEGLETAQQHLEHAKQLAKKLDTDPGDSAERRPARETSSEPARTERKKERVK